MKFTLGNTGLVSKKTPSPWSLFSSISLRGVGPKWYSQTCLPVQRTGGLSPSRSFQFWLLIAVGAWPIGHGVMQVCGYAGLRYVVRRRKGIGHMALWFSRICTKQRLCCFRTICRQAQGIGVMVSFTPYAITHIGSLRMVEVQVPWITKDHGSVLECWRLVLSAAFVSLEFVQFRECLVVQTEIYVSYPALSQSAQERVREHRSFISAFLPFSAYRDRTFVHSFFGAVTNGD